MQPDWQRRNDFHSAARYLPALVLIGVGALFFLSNLHIIYMREVFSYWPVILIVVGVFKMADSPSTHERTFAVIVLATGALFLAHNLGFLPMGMGQLWPLILIGVGILMLSERMSAGRGHQSAGTSAPGALSETAIFGGGKRKFNTPNFESAHLTAVFGGFEIDLRGSSIAADSAVIVVDAIFGGAEIKVPDNWSVVMQGTGIFGGYSDSTTQPNAVQYPNPKRLFVKGSAIFGGVEVKN